MKVYIRSIWASFFVFLMIIAIFVGKYIPVLQYADELITILLGIVLLYHLFFKKKTICKNDIFIIVLYLLILMIGVISTMVNKIQKDIYINFLDILTLSKVIICPIGIKCIIDNRSSYEIMRILNKPAKIFLIIGCICAIISQFIDIGMAGYARYGIHSFYFIFGFQHIFSLVVLACIIVIMSVDEGKRKKKYIYIILAMIQMLLTVKGPSTIWGASIFFILTYFKKQRKRISVIVIIILGIICVTLGQYQIQNYFLEETAPRIVLYQYSVITAKNYFPFGAGFSTFGSPISAQYYSKLYYKYNFDELYGMNPDDTAFLNDNYWPAILGEFGFFGLLIAIYIFYKYFKSILKSDINSRKKALILSVIFFLMIHSLGSAIFTTNATILLLMLVSISINIEGGNDDK